MLYLHYILKSIRNSYAEDDNDFSLCISVTHGENRFLFPDDAELVRLSEIMEQTDGTFDFLKVPHHRKYESNTKMFFEITPTKKLRFIESCY